MGREMKITVAAGKPEGMKSELLAVFVAKEEVGKGFFAEHTKKLARGREFEGEFKKTSLLHLDGNVRRVLLVGLGERKRISAETFRRASSFCVSAARELRLDSFDIAVRSPEEEFCHSVAEGLTLSSFIFDKYKPSLTEKSPRLKAVNLISNGSVARLQNAVDKAQAVCDNVNFVKGIILDNADIMNPVGVTKVIMDACRKLPVKVTIIAGEELRKTGLNAIYTVGKGSAFPPRLIIVEYRGDKSKKDAYGLVGKGITFDSGGINLKPTGFIETMRYDKAGALAVFAAVKTIAEQGMKVNVVAALPFAENIIGSHAYKPGDMIRTYSGKTIEVKNTDAEGRLVLSDALGYMEKNYKPKFIVELSTLTGAVLAALGEFAAGMICEDDKLASMLDNAGKRTYERVWRLPLYEEYKEELESDIADVPNMAYKDGRYAGTIMGGAFLGSFVDHTPFAHLDIAGAGWYEKQRYHIQKGPTGMGVRLLVELLSGLAK